ncbi:DUF1189 domain-containing protein [Clostridium sp. YIM B02505]|uniref:DUF1189 domain-containing protein n=1 Tax=Clostridium yunnanense TaxID=2800325 RepID=A0ABS1EVR0_9CLOT|nr:DUF1189 domain-containing protein [Clostridium yunnanense]MBK1813431.1 DUF1189 domain-containing protein [Clostridium yunnanense]
MQKKDNFFKKFLKAIVDVKYYINFNRETLGRAFLYLLIMSILLGGINSIKTVYSVTKAISSAVSELNNNDIDFRLEDGVMNISSSPFTYKDNDTLIIVDTTKNASEFDKSIIKDKSPNMMYVFKDKFIMNQQNGQNQDVKYSDFGAITVTKEGVINFIGTLKWLSILLVPLFMIGMFIGHMFSALVVAVIGILINIVIKAKVEFGNLYKLAIYALTLPTVIDIVRGAFSLQVPHFYKIYILVALIYIGIVLKTIKNDEINMELSEL